MNYDDFKDAFLLNFKRYLPQAYEDWTYEIQEVPKVNGYLEGLSLMPVGYVCETPALYLEDLYAYYRECKNLEKVCQRAASIFVYGLNYVKEYSKTIPMDLPKENIIYCIVNAEENQRLLKEAPHRLSMDLAIIYRVMLYDGDDGFNSAIITHEVAEDMGLTEEELYALATENTPKMLPAEIEYFDEAFAILSNQYKLLGASCLLYPGLVCSIAEKLNHDLYILPASIHEVFLVPACGQRVNDMNRIVIDANNKLNKPAELLAHHVYLYKKDCDMICVPLD